MCLPQKATVEISFLEEDVALNGSPEISPGSEIHLKVKFCILRPITCRGLYLKVFGATVLRLSQTAPEITKRVAAQDKNETKPEVGFTDPSSPDKTTGPKEVTDPEGTKAGPNSAAVSDTTAGLSGTAVSDTTAGPSGTAVSDTISGPSGTAVSDTTAGPSGAAVSDTTAGPSGAAVSDTTAGPSSTAVSDTTTGPREAVSKKVPGAKARNNAPDSRDEARKQFIAEKVALYTPVDQGPNKWKHPGGMFEFFVTIRFLSSALACSCYTSCRCSNLYEVRAYIDRPGRCDFIARKKLQLVQGESIQPSKIPYIEAQEMSEEEKIKGNGRARVSVNWGARSFRWWNRISAGIVIINCTGRNFRAVKAQIVRKCSFSTRGSSVCKSQVLSSSRLPEVPTGTKLQIGDFLTIPHVPFASGLTQAYYLRIMVLRSGDVKFIPLGYLHDVHNGAVEIIGDEPEAAALPQPHQNPGANEGGDNDTFESHEMKTTGEVNPAFE